MQFVRRLFLLGTHAAMLVVGFALGVYMLPIWVAEAPPPAAQLEAVRTAAQFEGRFARDLPGSDFLHWAEGGIFVAPTRISFEGDMAPGPDYKLYLVPTFVDTGAEFLALKSRAARIGSIKSFQGFALPVPEGVDVSAYTSAVIWCERFRQFISAARYQ
ncbi:MAG: DM13 domain-containing protein [Hyphomicrobiales bacterium]|nr:DM13 domain-containing protein [Hyphomicrobiales bacterium]